jgi:hypothetical protein
MGQPSPADLQRKRQLADGIVAILHWELGPVEDCRALADLMSVGQLRNLLAGLQNRTKELEREEARSRR